MRTPPRIAVGLALWLVFLGGVGLFILEPEQRARVLPIVLGLGALAYLAGEWFRGRRATRRRGLSGEKSR